MFELDIGNRHLRKNGESFPLAPKAMELLVLLARSHGRIVDKQEILDALWPGVAVEDGNLTQTVFLLRKALGESTEHPAYVVTVPRRGYRFAIPESPAPSVPQERSWKVVVLAVGFALAMAAGVWGYRVRTSTQGEPSRVVVLPFVNMTADPDTEYFSDGLTEELINALTQVDGLRVVARTTAFQFKGKANDIRQIGKQLNVDAVLEGSVRREGDRIRVTVQLNNAADGYHYWSETFDREARDAFTVQEEIARRVAGSLSNRKAPARVGSKPNREAYNLYLRGLYERNRSAFGRARVLFGEAVSKDPSFAAAYAAISYTYGGEAVTGQAEPVAAYSKSREYWTRALELDPDSSEGHTQRATWLMYSEHNWVESERAFQKAIALDPSYGTARRRYSALLGVMNRLEDAEREILQALECDPLNVGIASSLAFFYNQKRDYEKAEEAARAALAIDPLNERAKMFLTETLMETGRFAEAVELDYTVYRDPQEGERVRTAFRKGGEIGYWKALLDVRLQRRKRGAFNCSWIASTYARLGRKAEALQWLRRAVREKEPRVLNMRRLASFQTLRDDPEFQALAREVGLP